MEKMRSKWKKQEGFTLVEMLIVVAIIAILVAVSIPIVNNSLERARRATDVANERAAKAAFMAAYLTEEAGVVVPGKPNGDYFVYDALNGRVIRAENNEVNNALKSINEYGKCKDHENGKLVLQFKDNDVLMLWITSEAKGTQIDPYFKGDLDSADGIIAPHNGNID